MKPWRDLLRRGAKPKAPGHTGQVKPLGKCLPWGEALGPSAPTPRRRDPARRTVAPRPERTGWAQPRPAGADSLTRTLLQGRGENAEEPPEGRTEARSEWEADRPAGPEHKPVLGSVRSGRGAPRKPPATAGPSPARLPPRLPPAPAAGEHKAKPIPGVKTRPSASSVLHVLSRVHEKSKTHTQTQKQEECCQETK